MSSALAPLASGILLAKAPPNPNDVVGGWVAFFVVLAMGAAVVFLYFSLKKQLGKVNFEEQAEGAGGGSAGPAGGAQARDVAEPADQQPADQQPGEDSDSGQQPDGNHRPPES